MDITDWRKHIDAVVSDEGQWVGLLDENGWPILDFPAVVTVNAPEARFTAGSVEVVVSVANGAGSRLMDELVADGLGVMDEEKRLIPAAGPTRLVCVVRPGERLVYTVTHTVAEGRAAPSQITVHGVDSIDDLAWWPCPSIPIQWTQQKFTEWTTDASGVEYVKPRPLARVEFGTAADGYTVKGPARTTVRNVVQDSLDAVNALMKWQQPGMVVDYSGGADTTPELLIRTDDSPLWDTIAEPAKQAGLSIEIDLWWPGDPPVTVRTSRENTVTHTTSWDYPVKIIRIF